jgi:hypothetical protein
MMMKMVASGFVEVSTKKSILGEISNDALAA